MEAEIKKLSLKRGDILIIKRDFCSNSARWQETLQNAARVAGIDFDVPYVFVDDINDLAVIRLEDIKNV